MEIASFLSYLIIIIPSAIIHEYFHAWTANYFGDPTAKSAGRLTLNPIPHIDLWGTILLPFILSVGSGGQFMFAYAKPVPINPLYMRGRYASAIVAAAGPFANFLVAVVLAVLIRAIPITAFSFVLSKIVYANVILGLFNLIPIPPLDGSKVLYTFMPDRWSNLKFMLERYGFVVLLAFLFFGASFLIPVANSVYSFLIGK